MLRASVVVVLLAGTALAGCAGPGAGPGADGSPTCPHWGVDLGALRSTLTYVYNHTDPSQRSELEKEDRFGQNREWRGERPLDRFELQFIQVYAQKGRITAEAFAEDTGRPLDFQRTDGVGGVERLRTLQFGPGNHSGMTYHLALTEAGDPPAPSPARIQWSFDPDMGGDPTVRSEALVRYDVRYLHLHESCV